MPPPLVSLVSHSPNRKPTLHCSEPCLCFVALMFLLIFLMNVYMLNHSMHVGLAHSVVHIICCILK
jgi:hypothetical protein